MRLIAAVLLLTLSTPALAQEIYSGAGYEKVNFKTSTPIPERYDVLNTFTGVEYNRHAFEIGAFTSANNDDVRLQGLSADGFLYTNPYRDVRAFLTTGTVVMDVQIDNLGNKVKIFPRGGGGLEYKLTDRVSLRGMARYQSDWSYGLSVKWGWD